MLKLGFPQTTRKNWSEKNFSNSLIIHEAKTKENRKRNGFGNMMKHLHKLAKLSPSFSPEAREVISNTRTSV